MGLSVWSHQSLLVIKLHAGYFSTLDLIGVSCPGTSLRVFLAEICLFTSYTLPRCRWPCG